MALLTKIKNKLGKKWEDLRSPRLRPILAASEGDFLKKIDLEGDVPTRDALLAHLATRIAEGDWITEPGSITDLRMVLSAVTQQELVERADRLLEYDISPSGVKPAVVGNRIQWAENQLKKGREWLLMLNRHAWWPVLGRAYQATGDERYAQAFVAQLTDWIANVPMPDIKSEQNSCWRLMEVGMRMRVSWLPSYALFLNSKAFTDDVKMTMLRSIYDHASFLYLFKTNRNHLLRESNGLVSVATTLDEFRESDKWLNAALQRMEYELLEQVNTDGSHIEVSTGYQWLVIDEFEQLYRMLNRKDLDLPNENLKHWMESMYHMQSRLMRPDRSLPEINDGFILWQSDRIESAGEMLSRPDFSFIGSGGSRGEEPEDSSVRFRNAGLYVMRSDWSTKANYLLFDAAPYGGPHGHEDRLSIEVSANGVPIVVDSGSYTYAPEDPYRNYFVGSYSHNTVLVDGKSQVRRWNKECLEPKAGEKETAAWLSNAAFDFVSASYEDGYGVLDLTYVDLGTAVRNVSHRRRVLFLKPDYWLVIDELDSAESHEYSFLFHAAPGVSSSIRRSDVLLADEASGAGLRILPLGQAALATSVEKGSESPIQGWFSVDHHKKVENEAIIFKRSGSRVVQAFLLIPTPHGVDSNLYVESSRLSSESEGIGVRVRTGAGEDYLVFNPAGSDVAHGPLRTSDKLAAVRLDTEGREISSFSSSD